MFCPSLHIDTSASNEAYPQAIKTLCYKWALTPRFLNVKLGPQRNYHKGQQTLVVGAFSVIMNLRMVELFEEIVTKLPAAV